MRLQLTLILVGVTAVVRADGGPVRVGLDTLFYADSDRVIVVSPQVAVHAALDDDGGEVGARVVVDGISAASVDVVSEATAKFTELREEADFSASKRLGAWLPSLRYRFSTEPDYRSHGIGVGLERWLAGKDTTFSVSYDLKLDTVGRTGTPFDAWSRSLTNHAVELGVTQLLDPRTLLRGVYTLTVQDGYMAKPYRFVPLFTAAGIDAARADGATLDLATFDRYRENQRPPEEVPDLRVRHAVGARLLRYLPGLGGSLRLDYRFYADSWNVIGHTLEAELALGLGAKWILRLNARGYEQGAAYFYQRTYVVAANGEIPTYRTVDRDLGAAWGASGGASIELTGKTVSGYLEASAQLMYWPDFLFLTDRTALVTQVGVRFTP